MAQRRETEHIVEHIDDQQNRSVNHDEHQHERGDVEHRLEQRLGEIFAHGAQAAVGEYLADDVLAEQLVDDGDADLADGLIDVRGGGGGHL